MDNHRRICVGHLITTFLISGIIYAFITSNIGIGKKLNHLQEEVKEIARVVLQGGSNAAKGAVTRNSDISDLVDSLIKKRTVGWWDELYTVQKQLKQLECRGNVRPSAGAVGEKRVMRTNFALESQGAKIVDVDGEPWLSTSFFLITLYISNEPRNLLNPSMEPGQCYAFRKNYSAITIQLTHEIFIEYVELEHISEDVSPSDTSSAPKDFTIYGIESKSGTPDFFLGSFQYDNSLFRRSQLFPVLNSPKYSFLKVKFTSNHGNPNHTCIYRFAVYGKT